MKKRETLSRDGKPYIYIYGLPSRDNVSRFFIFILSRCYHVIKSPDFLKVCFLIIALDRVRHFNFIAWYPPTTFYTPSGIFTRIFFVFSPSDHMTPTLGNHLTILFIDHGQKGRAGGNKLVIIWTGYFLVNCPNPSKNIKYFIYFNFF